MDDVSFRAAIVAANFSEEMKSVSAIVSTDLGGWELREFAQIPELIAAVAGGQFFPDLVVICQGWRDQFASRDIETAFQRLPLARWICVYGAWCESEGRHGSRWPAAFRVPIRSFRTRLAAEATVIQNGRAALPITADREEVFAFDFLTDFPALAKSGRTALVFSSDPALQKWLADLLAESGVAPSEEGPEGSPDLVVVDLDPISERSLSELRSIKEQYSRSRIAAIYDRLDPRMDIKLKDAGADVVVHKLTPPSQLAFELRSAICVTDSSGGS